MRVSLMQPPPSSGQVLRARYPFPVMTNRFWLLKRRGNLYVLDKVTGKKESLKTKDRKEAQRLRDARNDTIQQAARRKPRATFFEISGRPHQRADDFFFTPRQRRPPFILVSIGRFHNATFMFVLVNCDQQFSCCKLTCRYLQRRIV
jgi:hypothetical protein